MNSEPPTLFEPDRCLPEIDLSPVEIPPRSRLICLKPLGSETLETESLWSYAHRLSEAHALCFFDFILYYISGYKKRLFEHDKKLIETGSWKHLVMAMSGSPFGARVADLLGQLTGRTDLRNLTLAPASQIEGITIRPRTGQVWCPHCLAEDSEPYERLHWAVADVTHCHKHGAPLAQTCSHCGKGQKMFSARSSILRCVHCGHPKSHLGKPPEPSDLPEDVFGRWASGEVAEWLHAARCGELAKANIGIRTLNFDLCASMPEINGITCLSERIGAGRTTARDWMKNNRGIPLKMALRWSWLCGVGLQSLFTAVLSLQDFRYRPLPSALINRAQITRNAPVPADSTALYLAALKLSAANPFRAPRLNALTAGSGVHFKHPAFKEPHYLKLIHRLRERERIFFRKERIWREVSEVHAAAIKVVEGGHRLGRNRVGREMERPGCFCGHLARAYLSWFKKRFRNGDESVLRPKEIPLDVRAYWSFEKGAKTPKGG
jgi:hypothetical protein